MLSVKIFRRHGKHKLVFLRPETDRVIPALCVDHTLRKSSRVNQLAERTCVMTILLVVEHLSAHHYAHICESSKFGIGTGGIGVILARITRGKVLVRRGWGLLSRCTCGQQR